MNLYGSWDSLKWSAVTIHASAIELLTIPNKATLESWIVDYYLDR